MFLLVIATGSHLLHCSMDNFSNLNEARIKLLSSHPSGHVEVRCPRGKKIIHYFDAVAKAIYKEIILCALGCLNLPGSCHFFNLRHICSDSFHALQSPGISGV